MVLGKMWKLFGWHGAGEVRQGVSVTKKKNEATVIPIEERLNRAFEGGDAATADEAARMRAVANLETLSSNVHETDKASILTLTIPPTVARTMLALRNPDRNAKGAQRGIRQGDLRRYESDMREGRWKWNGDPFRINASFWLIDGQHRLEAIVNTGFVLHNAQVHILREPDVERTMNLGIPGTLTDVMRLGGLAGASLGNSRKAAIVWEHCGFDPNKRRTLSKLEQGEIVAGSDLRDAVTLIPGRAPAGILGAFLAAYRRSPDEAVEFFMAALEGRHDMNGTTVSALRYLSNWLIRVRTEKNYSGSSFIHEATHRAISCWNAYRTGRPIKMIPRYRGMGHRIPEAI